MTAPAIGAAGGPDGPRDLSAWRSTSGAAAALSVAGWVVAHVTWVEAGVGVTVAVLAVGILVLDLLVDRFGVRVSGIVLWGAPLLWAAGHQRVGLVEGVVAVAAGVTALELGRYSFATRPARLVDPTVRAGFGRDLRLGVGVAVVTGLVAWVVGTWDRPGWLPGLAVLGAVVVVVLVSRAGLADRWGPRSVTAALVVAVVVVGVGLAAATRTPPPTSTPPEAVEADEPPIAGTPAAVEVVDGDPAGGDGRFDVEVLVRFLPILLLAAIGLFVSFTFLRDEGQLDPDPTLYDFDDAAMGLAAGQAGVEQVGFDADEVVGAFDAALLDLDATADPAQAVRFAFAHVEAVAAEGATTDRNESARQFLDRVAPHLRHTGDDLRRLTDLFEQARFSDHRIDERMRTDAVAALAAVRDELRPAEPAAGES